VAWGSVTAQTFVLESVFTSTKRSGAPTTCYFALLYSAAPITTLGTEPTIGSNAYARVGITNDDSLFTITSGAMTNDVEVRWPMSTGLWYASPLNQWAIYDAATAGTCWAFGELTAAIDVSVANRTPVLAAGDLDLTQAA
jgi:hypothetical protein